MWSICGVLVIGGLLGVFGRGPLSKATLGSPEDAVRLEYERFTRFRTPAVLTLTLAGMQLQSPAVRVRISNELMESIKLEQTVPRPVATALTTEGTLLTFQTASASAGGVLRFAQEPGRIGVRHGHISIEGVREFDFVQIVYP